MTLEQLEKQIDDTIASMPLDEALDFLDKLATAVEFRIDALVESTR